MNRTVPPTLSTTSAGLNVSPGIDTSTEAFASEFAVTVSVALPTMVLLPSTTDARICVVPIPAVVITPPDETVATAVLVLLHVSERVPKATAESLPSRADIVACAEKPIGNVASDSATITLDIVPPAAITPSAVDPLMPLRVAVIVTVPAATAVTSPDAFTVATAFALELHVGVPATMVPPDVFATAESCAV